MHAPSFARCRAWCRTSVVVLLLVPPAAHAQQRAAHLAPIDVPHWVNSRTILGFNMLLGGVSAGVLAELRGGSFFDAFGTGATGGLVVFLGKDVAARDFHGAGMLGRQVAAIGGSIVQNAGAGLRPLDRVALPLGPAHLLVDTRQAKLHARIDPVSVAVIAVGLAHPQLQLDAAESVSSGVPVFRIREGVLRSPWTGRETGGMEIASVLFFGALEDLEPEVRSSVRSHERLHTLQSDAFQAYWGRPLLDWMLPETPGWKRARPFLDVNIGDAITELTDAILFSAYASRPWEIEAEALANGRR